VDRFDAGGGELCEACGVDGVERIDFANQVVRDASELGLAGTTGSDLEVTVDLHTVRADDFRIATRRQLDGELGLAGSGGPHHHDQRHAFVVHAGHVRLAKAAGWRRCESTIRG
jgi:hypothetical protein